MDLQKIDAVYYCRECLIDLLFVSDIVDHQKDTGHRGVSRIGLSEVDDTLTA